MNTQTLLNSVSTINQEENKIIVDAKEFLKELRQVAVSVAKPSDHRPNLTFVHVRIESEKLLLEATDSHTMQQTTVKANIPAELVGKEFLIDGKFAKNLSKAPTKLGKQLGIYPKMSDGKYAGITKYYANQEEFIDDSQAMVSSFGYPDLDCLQPRENMANVMFDVTKKEIFPVLQELKKIAQDKTVRFEIEDNKVKLGADVVERQKDELIGGTKKFKATDLSVNNLMVNEDKVESRIFNDRSVYFNVDYLIKQLRHVGNREKLTLRLYAALRPFTVIRESDALSVICPLRVF